MHNIKCIEESDLSESYNAIYKTFSEMNKEVEYCHLDGVIVYK